MRKSLKIILVSLLILTVFSVGVFAGTNLTTITAYINNSLSMKVDNEVWKPVEADGTEIKPITYNGRTYLPVRAVCEKFGIPVDWDNETQTVLLGEKDWYKSVESDVYGNGLIVERDYSLTQIGTDTFDYVYSQEINQYGINYAWVKTNNAKSMKMVFKNTGETLMTIFLYDKDGKTIPDSNIVSSPENPVVKLELNSGEVKTVEFNVPVGIEELRLQAHTQEGKANLIFGGIQYK